MNRYLILVLSVLLSLCVVGYAAEPAARGITFPLTRVIYPESEAGGISFTITNNTDNLYLLQSRVIPDQGGVAHSEKVPFIVIPPLTRFEPGASVTLLILQSGKITDVDRESLWRLALKTIPAQSEVGNSREISGTSLLLALQNNLKLFYRPAALPVMTADELAEQLEFSVHDGMLIVRNPSPYHVTFSELLTDGRTVETESNKTISPHGTVSYPVGTLEVHSLAWSVTNEYGWSTDRRERSLH